MQHKPDTRHWHIKAGVGEIQPNGTYSRRCDVQQDIWPPLLATRIALVAACKLCFLCPLSACSGLEQLLLEAQGSMRGLHECRVAMRGEMLGQGSRTLLMY